MDRGVVGQTNVQIPQPVQESGTTTGPPSGPRPIAAAPTGQDSTHFAHSSPAKPRQEERWTTAVPILMRPGPGGMRAPEGQATAHGVSGQR